jgi:hypothetical protein
LWFFVPVQVIAGLMALFVAGAEGPSAKPTAKPAGVESAQLTAANADVPTGKQRLESEVAASLLNVFDQPEDTAYVTGTIHKGDRVLVRVESVPGTGWLAIDPLPTEICWIERSSIEMEEADDSLPPVGRDEGQALCAWVRRPRAVIRSGNLRARLPGPPRFELPQSTMVHLVDRPPLRLRSGDKESDWLAIVPPVEVASYVRADGLRWTSAPASAPSVAEVRASFEEPSSAPQGQKPKSESSSFPPELASELQRLDATHRTIIASQPIEHWRFEPVRLGYQALLKRNGDRADLEEEIRTRLARLTQHEQAAQAARAIESILAKSHRRDQEVAQVRQRVAQLERTRARAFDAVGFVQPSARKVDGHKVFTLIGKDGSTIAYLDIPPGLDPRPLLARRVGIRGQAHYSEDLGTRLITVRDMERIEAKR